MKKFLVFLSFCFITQFSWAQTMFEYDQAGNRIRRYYAPVPDLSPTINLNLSSMAIGQSRDFVVRLSEILGVNTFSPISFNLSVPLGYSVSFNNTLTTITAMPFTYTVSNPNWMASSVLPSELDMISTAAFSINANSDTRIGFTVINVSAQSNSLGSISVSIYPDTTKKYDSISSNNNYSRTITGL